MEQRRNDEWRGDPDGEQGVYLMMNTEKVMEDDWGLSNSQVNGYLEGANIGQVNGHRNWVDGQRTSFSTFISGVPEQTP